MKDTDIPTKFVVPFASSATAGTITEPVPTTAQPNGRASLPTGFTQVNFTAVGAGGIPPWGADMNGILNQSTAWIQWCQAGFGIPLFDASFSTSIGGYPKGAIVQSASVVGTCWQSTADDNTSDPDAAGANWVPFPNIPHGSSAYTVAGTIGFTVPGGIRQIYIRAIGGGGGGGVTTNAAYSGGAGGGGGVAEGWISVVPGQLLTGTVGFGGPGGNNSPGLDGGTTTISGLTATGGTGGHGEGLPNMQGGFSGAGAGGTLNYGLGDGSAGSPILTVSGVISGATGIGGGPGGQTGTGSGTPGFTGRGPGGGGGGNAQGFGGSTGGNGAPGAILIWW